MVIAITTYDYDKINNEIEKELKQYIDIYIKQSENSGNTQDEETVRNLFASKASSLIINNAQYSLLTTADTNRLISSLSNYVENVGIRAYQKSLIDKPRAVNNLEPFSLEKDSKKKCKTMLSIISKKISASIDSLLTECTKTKNCPNEQQVNNYITYIINKAMEENGKWSSNETQYIKNNSEKYRQQALKKYYNYIKDHKINNTMPWGINKQQTSTTKKISYKSEWIHTNTSFSGCDAVVSASMKTSNGSLISIVIGEVQTISYSMYEKQSPVNACGNMNAKDYVHGKRFIAGSIIMLVFNQHWAAELMKRFAAAEGYSNMHYLVDELAPMDLTISFANEYGSQSRLAIYGVRLYKEGMVISINDIYTEGTYEFVAMDLDYLADVNSANTLSNKPIPNTTPIATTTNDTVPPPPTISVLQKDVENNTDSNDTEDTTVNNSEVTVEETKKYIQPDGINDDKIYVERITNSDNIDPSTEYDPLFTGKEKETRTYFQVKNEIEQEYNNRLESINSNNKNGLYASEQDYQNAINNASQLRRYKLSYVKNINSTYGYKE